MRLYQFNLPDKTNDAQHNYVVERIEWAKLATQRAGGLTKLSHDSVGEWEHEGRIINERMHVYQVACEPAIASSLVADALRLFSDQHSIFYAELGTAHIAERDNVRKITAKAA